MTLFYLFLVAIIQGVTEFLPVSSSGHLILLPQVLGAQDQGLTIDVAVHVGTLVAVVLYFRRDVGHAMRGIPRLLIGKIDTPQSKLAFLLLIATIPVVVAGLALKVFGLTELLRSTKVIGWAMLIFGLVLYWADKWHPSEKSDQDWTTADAIKMGLWQMLALIPGTSRSGITMTGARQMGYDRISAARLSMLMSIPTILASGGLLTLDIIRDGNFILFQFAAIAAAFACISAFIALAIMMRFLRTFSFTPFVIYRVILGVAIILYL